jgi:hypothetical protein
MKNFEGYSRKFAEVKLTMWKSNNNARLLDSCVSAL